MVLLRGRPETATPASASSPGHSFDASTLAGTPSDLSSGPHKSLLVEGFAFLLPIGFEADRDQAMRLLSQLVRQIDLAEPFGRIEEAIREAQRLGGGETHEKAA
jgi:hypothetical protein